MNKLLPLLLLSTTAFSAHAAGLRYSFVEAGYAQAKIDSGSDQALGQDQWAHIDDMKPRGAYVRGSVAAGETLYVLADYRQGKDTTGFGIGNAVTSSDGSFEADVEQGSIGLGFHHGISERTDLIGEVAYLWTHAKVYDVRVDGRHSLNTSDAGASDARLSVGVRSRMGKHVEGWALANYIGGDAYDRDFGATLGGQLKLNETWGLVGEANLGGTISEYRVGIRASF